MSGLSISLVLVFLYGLNQVVEPHLMVDPAYPPLLLIIRLVKVSLAVCGHELSRFFTTILAEIRGVSCQLLGDDYLPLARYQSAVALRLLLDLSPHALMLGLLLAAWHAIRGY